MRVLRVLRAWVGLYCRPHCRALVLAVQDGSYPTEVATAMRQKRMSEERRKLNVWTRPQER
jgi:hypothetical protein